jgi:hypothetical protein
MIEAALVAGGILIFIAGFYTGLYIARHSYVDREVAKIVTTEKLVEVEKPVVIQVPRPEPAKRPSGGGLPIMGSSNKNDVLNPAQRQEAEKMTDLLSQLPEA